MKIVFSWDDGAVEDLKLINLHKKYGIPGMFFVPTFNREGRKVITKEDISSNCSELIQFGGHTFNHVYLPTIEIDDVEHEILANKKYLEDSTNQEINHFCLPGGKYNRQILKIVGKYFKSCRTADTMNVIHKKKFLIKPTIHFYNRGYKSLFFNSLKHFNFKGAFFVLRNKKKNYFDLIKSFINFESKRDSILVVWGHSWEIEEKGLWDVLEDFFSFVSSEYSDSIISYTQMFNF